MRLPKRSSSYQQRHRYGRYVARRLRRARMTVLAADVEKANLAVLDAGRSCEDAQGPIQDALADRDGFDDNLDDVAQNSRVKVAGRSLDAMTKAPYTLIFPQGISYYTAAPLDEEQKRYGELKQRLHEHLPQEDEVRQAAIPAIDTGLDGFVTAMADLNKARTDASIASTRLDTVNEAWEKQMEKAYGVLVAEVGRARAEQFFPRPRTKKESQSATALKASKTSNPE